MTDTWQLHISKNVGCAAAPALLNCCHDGSGCVAVPFTFNGAYVAGIAGAAAATAGFHHVADFILPQCSQYVVFHIAHLVSKQ